MADSPPSALWPFLAHPQATPEQLRRSASELDGVPPALERALRYHAARLTQAAGVLLRLPQTTVAAAIVVLARFYAGPEGGSFALHSIKDISAACVYLTAKTSLTPLPAHLVLSVYAVLTDPATSPLLHSSASTEPPAPPAPALRPDQLQAASARLQRDEALVLRTIGYQTHTSLPHPLALVYLQMLGLLRPAGAGPTGPGSTGGAAAAAAAEEEEDRGVALMRRALALLNAALLAPQRLYLAHGPAALAVAAVYRAAREVGVPLAGGAWWEMFDVDREELGFLVVSLGSVEGWVRKEAGRGEGLWTAEEVRAAAERERGRDGEGMVGGGEEIVAGTRGADPRAAADATGGD